ncbi:hypothetical protein [Nocardia tengchongensis]|uniref:hypothetical protein n=1 Tax=Nocardia tengchongensis TaxID=2055889 RepID=UPI0036AAA2D3
MRNLAWCDHLEGQGGAASAPAVQRGGNRLSTGLFRADFHVQWLDTGQANAVLQVLRALFQREEMSTDGTLTPREEDGRWCLDGVTVELDYETFLRRHGQSFTDWQFAVEGELRAEVQRLAPGAIPGMQWDYSDRSGHYRDGPDDCDGCPGLNPPACSWPAQ